MASITPKVGITTYNYPPQELINLARTAERLGFEGLWFGEHYVIPGAYGSKHPGISGAADHKEDDILSPSVRLYDPWFTLGAIAGATTTLKLGTAICILPIMHPLLLARATATAHDVSGGRFRLGMGAGWLKEEFEALGVPFEERGGRLDEAIDILREAWKGGFFEHQGKAFQFGPLQITPHATPVPMVCGGNTGPALRRVVRVADAWMNSAMVPLDEALRLRDTIEQGRAAAGKTGAPLTYYLRPPEASAEEVGRFVAEGFDNIVLWGPHVWPQSPDIPLDVKVEGLTRLARDLGVAPAASAAA
jgi:probable F420-dependent oxidoreductase